MRRVTTGCVFLTMVVLVGRSLQVSAKALAVVGATWLTAVWIR